MILDQENSFFQSTETFEETIEQQIDTQLPSPATFFKRKSCRLGTLDSRSTETSHLERPFFQTPKKDKSGKILPDMIDLTPFVQSVTRNVSLSLNKLTIDTYPKTSTYTIIQIRLDKTTIIS